ncbi:MAG: hypothetical protein LBL30_03970 [Holosporales bacterium]|nr:hypothetical protein [Holosporales bacterium]
MSKEKLSFSKLTASGAVVAGCLGYCGIIGVGVGMLTEEVQAARALQPQAETDQERVHRLMQRCYPADGPIGWHGERLESVCKNLDPQNRAEFESWLEKVADRNFMDGAGMQPGLVNAIKTICDTIGCTESCDQLVSWFIGSVAKAHLLSDVGVPAKDREGIAVRASGITKQYDPSRWMAAEDVTGTLQTIAGLDKKRAEEVQAMLNQEVARDQGIIDDLTTNPQLTPYERFLCKTEDDKKAAIGLID